MMPCGALAHLLLILLPCTASAALVNRTIDDEDGDSDTGLKPAYFPPGDSGWSQGNSCAKCPFPPNKAFHNTWHEAYQLPTDPEVRTITTQFNGTAVYVFNMFATPVDPSRQNSSVTYMEFELDGTPVGSYLAPIHTAASPERRLVYTNSNIADGAHTLVIRVPSGPTGRDASFVLFDYIEYTTSDAGVRPSHDTHGSVTRHPFSNGTAPSSTIAASPSSASHSIPSSSTSPSPGEYNHTSSGEDRPSRSPPPSATGEIVGDAVGGAALLMVVGALVAFRRKIWALASRRRTWSILPLAAEPTPSFPSPTETQCSQPHDTRPGPHSTTMLPELHSATMVAQGEDAAPAVLASHNTEMRGTEHDSPQSVQIPRNAVPLVSEPMPSPVDEARVRALADEVMYMRTLFESPPGYESEGSGEGDAPPMYESRGHSEAF